MSFETRRPEVTSSRDSVPLVNSCSAAVDLREEIPGDGISQCHVTTSLFDDAVPCEGKYPETETLRINSQDMRASPDVQKKASKSDLMSGEGGSRQKKIKVAVVVVACLLLLTSFVLVGVTLSMSSHIDDMVRKTYEPQSVHMTTRNQQQHQQRNKNSHGKVNSEASLQHQQQHQQRHRQQQQQQEQQWPTTTKE